MIAVEAIGRSFGPKRVLDSVTLRPAPGRTTVLLGPSGSGKSTVLRAMVGLVVPDSGSVRFDGEPLRPERLQAVRRRIGYVIQDGGLFPHLTAGDNATLLARHLGRAPAWIGERLAGLAALLRLPADALARYPRELSGGERQRVALLRALFLDPDVLLLDEPLGALDATTRGALQAELRDVFKSPAGTSRTVLLVTHDLHEAARLGDEIALMRDGRIVQQGTLEDLLARPAEPFVREFIGAQRVDARLAAVAGPP
jgi:osmoprotectant transport system ATP-binding protein